ncbi:MAG: zinc-ribbon domain-containing protein [Deltaproteobacteria bacterium]|nr:MAG: zinc-ribbon domain-containing protein [Deltaproteobacteria bacterium]
MDVTCKSCGARLTIPDRKVPPNQAVSLTCPRCKGKIRVNTREHDGNLISRKEEFDKPGLEYEEDTSPLDLFEEGARLALVLDGNEGDIMEISSALEELSYKPVLPSSISEAMGKLRLHHFDLILLSDGFDGQDLERSPITHYLNHLSISIRRKVFLVLLSNEFKTMDNMMAFSKSANLVVHPDDLSNLPLILKKAISDNEKFYKVLMDTLKELGKE